MATEMINVGVKKSATCQSIEQYIFDKKHSGKIKALWFEDEEIENDFIELLHFANSGRITLTELRSPSASIDAEIDCQINEIQKRIRSGSDILIFRNHNSTEVFQQIMLEITSVSQPSIFVLDERLSSSFISDKVIYINAKGEIEEEFSPFFAEC